jgi:hypothetical protein
MSVVCAYVQKKICLTIASKVYLYTSDPIRAVLMTPILAYETLGKQAGACGTPAGASHRRGREGAPNCCKDTPMNPLPSCSDRTASAEKPLEYREAF